MLFSHSLAHFLPFFNLHFNEQITIIEWKRREQKSERYRYFFDMRTFIHKIQIEFIINHINNSYKHDVSFKIIWTHLLTWKTQIYFILLVCISYLKKKTSNLNKCRHNFMCIYIKTTFWQTERGRIAWACQRERESWNDKKNLSR